jgi:hypothetical protein
MAAAENPVARLAVELDSASDFRDEGDIYEEALKTADKELDDGALNILTTAQILEGGMIWRLIDLKGKRRSLDKCLKVVLQKLLKCLDRDEYAKMLAENRASSRLRPHSDAGSVPGSGSGSDSSSSARDRENDGPGGAAPEQQQRYEPPAGSSEGLPAYADELRVASQSTGKERMAETKRGTKYPPALDPDEGGVRECTICKATKPLTKQFYHSYADDKFVRHCRTCQATTRRKGTADSPLAHVGNLFHNMRARTKERNHGKSNMINTDAFLLFVVKFLYIYSCRCHYSGYVIEDYKEWSLEHLDQTDKTGYHDLDTNGNVTTCALISRYFNNFNDCPAQQWSRDKVEYVRQHVGKPVVWAYDVVCDEVDQVCGDHSKLREVSPQAQVQHEVFRSMCLHATSNTNERNGKRRKHNKKTTDRTKHREMLDNPETTIKKINAIYRSQKGMCAILAIAMSITPGEGWFVTLERKDDDIGYLESNLILIAKEVNFDVNFGSPASGKYYKWTAAEADRLIHSGHRG